jgi:hypothetical protein
MRTLAGTVTMRIEDVALLEFFECSRQAGYADAFTAYELAERFGHHEERQEFMKRCIELEPARFLADLRALRG